MIYKYNSFMNDCLNNALYSNLICVQYEATQPTKSTSNHITKTNSLILSLFCGVSCVLYLLSSCLHIINALLNSLLTYYFIRCILLLSLSLSQKYQLSLIRLLILSDIAPKLASIAKTQDFYQMIRSLKFYSIQT